MYVDKSLTLPEVFDRVAEKETIEEKTKLLKAYETRALKWFIDSLYNRDLSDITIPKYKSSNNPSGIAYMNIGNSISRIEAAINNKDRERIFNRNMTLVLEGVTRDEAILIEKVIKGERRITGVSKTVFKKAYPEFFRTEEKD
jgi:hypothetical protein